MEELTKSERKQIAEILNRRANEIAGFSGDYRKDGNHFGSVELALSREIDRLRRLANRVNPTGPEDDDEIDTLRKVAEEDQAEINELRGMLKDIGDFAHDRSTGPAVEDDLWEVRRMAYELLNPK